MSPPQLQNLICISIQHNHIIMQQLLHKVVPQLHLFKRLDLDGNVGSGCGGDEVKHPLCNIIMLGYDYADTCRIRKKLGEKGQE